jgi:tetratricopeptide (TPR) repeat protein
MESANSQDRHCNYYAAFLQAREPRLRGPEQDEALSEIAAEIDNVRAAWHWAVVHSKVAQIGQALESLYLYYDERSRVQEGEGAFRMVAESLRERREAATALELMTLSRLLARQGRFTYRLGQYNKARELVQESLEILNELEARDQPAAAIEKAFPLRVLGSILRGDGEYQQAGQLYQESLAIYRRQGDDLGTAGVLKQLGIVAGSLGEYDEARRLFQEALELYRATGDQYGIANTLNDLGIVAHRTGQYAEAQRLYQECLAIRRQIGHRWGVGTTLNNLGYLAFAQGQYAEATQLLEESLSIQSDIGDRYNIANSLVNLGATVRELGKYDQARSYFSEALRSATEVGAIPLVLEVLDGVARLLVASEPGKEERAAELFAFVSGHPAGDKPTKDGAEGGLADLAAHLSPDALVTAQERAKTLDLDGLVAEILDELRQGRPER